MASTRNYVTTDLDQYDSDDVPYELTFSPPFEFEREELPDSDADLPDQSDDDDGYCSDLNS